MNNNFHKENLLILFIFGILFGIIVFFYSDSVHENVYGMIYVTPIIICIVMSLSLYIHYKKSHNFSLAFLFLGLSTLSLLIAEILWILMPYLGISQYESYPDIFYFGYNIFSLVFPWFILKHYKICFNAFHYIIILLITISGVFIYIILSNSELESSSFVLGLLFVSLTSILIGISIVTMTTLKNTKIFRVWIIIMFSFFISGISDIWYYASENVGDWEPSNWVNIVWFVSYLIIIFALGQQRHSYITKNRN